jgi:Arc/MetJ-type ribon-helix-helix transcriptional regulator
MTGEHDMRITTLNLPARDVAMVDVFVDGGIYASRSEFIRWAIKAALEKERAGIFTQYMVTDHVRAKRATSGEPDMRKGLPEDDIDRINKFLEEEMDDVA